MIFEMRTYDQDYQERVETSSGTPLRLRMIVPADKDKLAAGFDALSEQSRYTRFFTHKNGLTAAELEFFTETDGFNHFAMGAAALERDGAEGRGVGIARFIRSGEEPKLAEVAVTVIDEMQGQGIGRILLERLVEAARERGVDRFRFQLLGNNEKARGLIESVCPSIQLHGEGDIVSAEVELHAPGEALVEGLFDLLRLVASRAILTPLEAGLKGTESVFPAVTNAAKTQPPQRSPSLDSSKD